MPYLRFTRCTNLYIYCSELLKIVQASKLKIGLQKSNRTHVRRKGYIASAGQQAFPINGYYAEMLKKPSSKVPTLAKTPPVALPPSVAGAKSPKEETLEKPRIVFGFKVAGQAERRKEIAEASRVIADVTVPPKPIEPDNCCMSGCINCVWDMYREEMEEWAEKGAQAKAVMQARRAKVEMNARKIGQAMPQKNVAVSIDDDGGGNETNWISEESSGDLFNDIPVGIREFMRTEKKLKQMHSKERTASTM